MAVILSVENRPEERIVALVVAARKDFDEVGRLRLGLTNLVSKASPGLERRGSERSVPRQREFFNIYHTSISSALRDTLAN